MESEIRFPVPGDPVRIQTHTSQVFLVGDEVFKLKKPVRFSFLDYGSLEARRNFCEREVVLNRRFSPSVYLGVLPVARAPDGALVVGGSGEPVDYAVHMRRLPERSMLARRLGAGDVRAEELVALADLLARFYATADHGPEASKFGRIEQVRENTEENFATTTDFPEEVFPDLARQFLAAANRAFLEAHGELFAERIRAGRVVDGHGDLKPENVFLTDAGPVVTDCIEFNDRFRCGDVLVDVGYLTMGLLAAGRRDLRAAFLERFRKAAEPDLPENLLRFYETYRAVVKGKIEGYRAVQPEVPAAERGEAARISRAHFALARDIALSLRPVLVVLCGVTGAGKSTLAPVFARGLDAAVFEADRIRKELAGLPAATRVEVPFGADIYSPEMTARTYAEMGRRAREALSAGRSAVLDATHLTRVSRRAAFAAAEGTGALRLLVEARAGREALSAHHGGGRRGVSDGRPEILEEQLARWEPAGGDEAPTLVSADCSGALSGALRDVARQAGEALASIS